MDANGASSLHNLNEYILTRAYWGPMTMSFPSHQCDSTSFMPGAVVNNSNVSYVMGNKIVTYTINLPQDSDQTSSDTQEVLNYLERSPRRPATDPIIPIPPHTSTSHSPDALDLTIELINDIGVLLKGCPEKHRDLLMLELSLLNQVLVLVKPTLACYADTPLAEDLARTVNAEVDRCHFLLQGILNRYRRILSSVVGFMWRTVWWAEWEANELKSPKMKLAASRISLYKFLEAMQSYAPLFRFSTWYRPTNPLSLEFRG